MTTTNTKRRPNGFSEAELKAYDGLSKTELFEVLGRVMRQGTDLPTIMRRVMPEGYTPPADLDLAKAIKAINKDINPDSGTASGAGGGTTDRILSAAQYLALTAISAHAGGMPSTLYQAGVSKDHRESFQARGFVQIAEGGAASITPEGNKALDRYEATQKEKAATKAGGGGGQPSAQGTGGQSATPTPQASQTPVATNQPTPTPVADAPQASQPPATTGAEDFGG